MTESPYFELDARVTRSKMTVHNVSSCKLPRTDKQQSVVADKTRNTNLGRLGRKGNLKCEKVVIKSEPMDDFQLPSVNVKQEPLELLHLESSGCGKTSETRKREKPTIMYEDVALKTEPSNQDQKKLKWEPQHWKTQLENIVEMRKDWSAPVDSMGCDVISDKDSEPKVNSV